MKRVGISGLNAPGIALGDGAQRSANTARRED